MKQLKYERSTTSVYTEVEKLCAHGRSQMLRKMKTLRSDCKRYKNNNAYESRWLYS